MPIKPRHKDCHNPQCPLANPPGHSLTKKGYWRIHVRTPDKDKYLHRWVMEKLAGRALRPDEEVHHLDFDARNCCPYNLALLPGLIHQAFENSSRKQMIKGLQGFRSRPSANAEIDQLVVEMLWADMQGRGKEWSVLRALDEISPNRRQLGMFDSPE